MHYVISIRKQEREVIKKGSTERKFSNKMRHVCEEDNFYLDEYCPFKRACFRGDEDLVVTCDHVKFKGKLLHVVQMEWKEIDAKDK